MNGQPIYPISDPYRVGELDVGDGHTLFWAQRGNRQGIPIVLLHGGPGSKPNGLNYRTLDPSVYRIVTFGQRGCGRSRPLGSLEENNLQRLIGDIDALRQHLEIEQWVVCGGSWGSTLGLAYGASHPESCLGFVFRGVFLCTESEVQWWLYGMQTVFPEHWEKFAFQVPVSERGDLVAAYGRLLNDPVTALEAARTWKSYERACSTLLPAEPVVEDDAPSTIAAARIHNHYFANRFYTDDRALLSGVQRIRHLPCSIIHGRYDMICPVVNAFTLAKHWGSQHADLRIIDGAGHSIREPGILCAMMTSAEQLAQRI